MDAGELAQGYDYLLSMKLWSLTLERVSKYDGSRHGPAHLLCKL